MPLQHLVPGIDPTGIPGAVTKADLLQMWTAGRAIETEGFVKWSQAAPDVVTNPEYAFYIWMELDLDDAPTGNAYYYDGSAWVLFPTTDGTHLADNSVPISKLKGTGAAALDLIQRNAANNGWQFVSPPNAIAVNTLPVDKLVAPDNAFNYVLTCLLGVKAFTLITDFFNTVAASTINILKLIPGAAGTFLRTNGAGTATEWTTADINDILAADFLAGQVPVRNAGNTAWAPLFPAIAPASLTNGGLYYALPLSGAVSTIAHVNATIPRIINMRIRCMTATDGYSIGDELELSGVIAAYGVEGLTPAYTWSVDSTNITVQGLDAAGFAPIPYFSPKAGGDLVAFDSSKWKIKINYVP